jgi:uncharacterized DUF497 family protein
MQSAEAQCFSVGPFLYGFVVTIVGVAVRYEWDERKRLLNVRKHGIDFVDCPVVFEGLDAFTMEDRREYGERRFLTFGWLRDHLVVIAHTERNGTIRIISARKATSNEQRLYFQQKVPH